MRSRYAPRLLSLRSTLAALTCRSLCSCCEAQTAHTVQELRGGESVRQTVYKQNNHLIRAPGCPAHQPTHAGSAKRRPSRPPNSPKPAKKVSLSDSPGHRSSDLTLGPPCAARARASPRRRGRRRMTRSRLSSHIEGWTWPATRARRAAATTIPATTRTTTRCTPHLEAGAAVGMAFRYVDLMHTDIS